MNEGYAHIKINDGVSSNASYPYEAKDGTCRYSANHKAGNTIGYELVKENDEKDLMRAVAEGPVACAAKAQDWSSYKKGIFDCQSFVAKALSWVPVFGSPIGGVFNKAVNSGKKLNHGVTVVG